MSSEQIDTKANSKENQDRGKEKIQNNPDNKDKSQQTQENNRDKQEKSHEEKKEKKSEGIFSKIGHLFSNAFEGAKEVIFPNFKEEQPHEDIEEKTEKKEDKELTKNIENLSISDKYKILEDEKIHYVVYDKNQYTSSDTNTKEMNNYENINKNLGAKEGKDKSETVEEPKESSSNIK